MKKLLLIAVVVLGASSCASILTGTKDTIQFDTDPQGAAIYINGLEVCTTPCAVEVKRSLSEKIVQVQKEGYETRMVTLDRQFNPVSIINLTSLIGWGIDAATGSLMKYSKKGYNVALIEKVSTAAKIDINTKNKSVDVYVVDPKQ